MASCKVCGAPHKACGPSTTVIPIDQRITRREDIVGVKRYPTTVNGTETILVLSDEDAKRAGLFKEKAAAPKNKSRTAANKAVAKPAPAAAPAAPENK